MKGSFILTINVNWFLTISFIFYNKCKFANAVVGINVRQAQENEFGFTVSIARTENPYNYSMEMLHKCTGTLISRQDVLTAEHCVEDILPSSIMILVGSIDITQATQFNTMFYVAYEQWATTINREFVRGQNDIAFLKIIGNVPDTIPIASLGNAPIEALAGSEVQIAGWGTLGDRSLPKVLYTATVKVLSKKECESKLWWQGAITFVLPVRNICTAAQPTILLSSGDSGGPVLFHGSVIATNSGLLPNYGHLHFPEQVNYHSGVRYYYDFIADILTNSNIPFE